MLSHILKRPKEQLRLSESVAEIKRPRPQGIGIGGSNLQFITKMIKENQLGCEMLSHRVQHTAGHTVETILNRDLVEGGSNNRSIEFF